MMYRLVNKVPVREPDAIAWARWFETAAAERRVCYTEIGDIRVSTVFLGVDHNFSSDGQPILFETMVFGGPFGDMQQRYSTWDDALVGHRHVVEGIYREMRNGREEQG